ncbi:unnamed protein product, partial [Cyprideis torosa]
LPRFDRVQLDPQGHNSPREFIVTQGPLHSTRDDLWRMVWESNSRAIVMLTRCIEKAREKCDHYWPYDTQPVYYGDIQVIVANESHYPDWTIREFKVTRGDTSRLIRHFHFTTWPDFGVPEPPQTLVRFVRAFREKHGNDGRPIVVHCSAGVGRSGTFIAIDRILHHLKNNDYVDIFGMVYEMRKERVWMVQTEQQYICIHQCLLAVLEGRENEMGPRGVLRDGLENEGFEACPLSNLGAQALVRSNGDAADESRSDGDARQEGNEVRTAVEVLLMQHPFDMSSSIVSEDLGSRLDNSSVLSSTTSLSGTAAANNEVISFTVTDDGGRVNPVFAVPESADSDQTVSPPNHYEPQTCEDQPATEDNGLMVKWKFVSDWIHKKLPEHDVNLGEEVTDPDEIVDETLEVEIEPVSPSMDHMKSSCTRVLKSNEMQATPPQSLAKRWKEDSSATFWRMLSLLYCKILVVMGLAFPIAELMSDETDVKLNFRGFYLYLTLGSLFFLSFIYVRMFIFENKYAIKRLKKFSGLPSFESVDVEIRRSGSSGGNLNASVESGLGSLKQSEVLHFVKQEESIHFGSFYLRVGVLVFGTGALIYSGLQLAHFFVLPGECYKKIEPVASGASLFFTFTQMYFVFLNAKVLVPRRFYIGEFGLMHLLATNLCTWLQVLVEETKHEFHELPAADHHRESLARTSSSRLHSNESQETELNFENVLHFDVNFDGAGCVQNPNFRVLGRLVKTASPFLFPCVIEYSLICAAVLYVMWRNLSEGDDVGPNGSRRTSVKVFVFTLCVEARFSLCLLFDRKYLSCPVRGAFLKMNSEVEKEPSGVEIQGADDGFAFPKFDGMEVLADHHEFAESGETAAPTDTVPGYTENDNQTGDASDQIEVSEDGGTVRKGKNSRCHCQREKRFTCGVCGKSLSTNQKLESHEFTHTGEKPFACRICGKPFAQSGTLSKHKLIHTGEKPFACRICGKAFGDKANLRRHEFIHSGEKPFACRICGKSFARSGSISLHNLTHTGEKPFACRICGKAFADRSALAGHKLIHSGEKPYICRICGKSFARSSYLSTHKLIHTRVTLHTNSPMVKITTKSSRHTYRMDCDGSNRGLFVGILVVVLTIIALIIFFVLLDENYKDTAVAEAYIFEFFLYVVSSLAVVIGMFRMRHMAFNRHKKVNIDVILLVIAQCGIFLYAIFVMVSSNTGRTEQTGTTALLTGFFMLVQAILQTVFILDAIKRHPTGVSQVRKKPGREFVTFLVLANLSMWALNTFETSKALAHPFHGNFFGERSWITITHISMPLAIFYRFHSTVCLCEIWTKSYKIS